MQNDKKQFYSDLQWILLHMIEWAQKRKFISTILPFRHLYNFCEMHIS